MKKLLLTLLFAVISTNSFAWAQRQPLPVEQCKIHAPYGFPKTTNVQPICRQGYLVGYDASAKIPKFVTYQLVPQNSLGCVLRSNAFATDQSIQGGATPQDYVGTPYDKGHQAPDGDLSWDQQVEYESFLMTNMAPQAGSLNRGIWKLLETSVRGWAEELQKPLTIYVGAVYDKTDLTIGKGVVVPHAFYKIVIDNNSKQVAGWWFPHVQPYPNLGNDLTKFRMTIANIEKASGVNFMFPRKAVELQPGKEWIVDFGKLTNDKRAKCGARASTD